MRILFWVMEVVILTLCAYAYIRRRDIVDQNKKIHIKGMIPKGWKEILCFTVIPISLVMVAFMLDQFYHSDMIFISKRLCLVALLWPIAISDYKEYKIPNKLILCGLAARLLLIIPEWIFSFDTLRTTIINEGIAIIGAVVVCLICMILARGSLGMGDLKLLIMMGALLGIEGICYAMFVSIFFSFIAAIILLISKKKGRKDTIPFAPFILLGTIVSIILSGV